MSPIRFQQVDSAPPESIVVLYQEAGWWKESAHARESIPLMIKGSFCFMVAATPDNEIIGMGRVISDGVSDAYIQDVVVKAAYRKQGIGAEIIRRLTKVCQDHNLEWIGLVAEPGTTRFYNGCGFKELDGYVPMLHRT